MEQKTRLLESLPKITKRTEHFSSSRRMLLIYTNSQHIAVSHKSKKKYLINLHKMLGFNFLRHFIVTICLVVLFLKKNGSLLKLMDSINIARNIIILSCFLAALLRVFSFCRHTSPSNTFLVRL